MTFYEIQYPFIMQSHKITEWNFAILHYNDKQGKVNKKN